MDSNSDFNTALQTATYDYNLGLAFSRVAQVRGAAVALRFPHGETVSFEELDLLSNRMARAMLELGVGRGDVVAIFNSKSALAFATMIACLKIGAPYTNLDLSSPSERVRKMLATCRPALLLFDGMDGPFTFDGTGFRGKAHNLVSEGFRALVDSQLGDDLAQSAGVTGGDPAYIMFTSGSTGFPKGAAMSHANVLNLIGWARTTFDISFSDVFTNVNPVYFDNSVFDFYAGLFSGATLCPVGADFLQDPRRLVRAVNDLGCTVWFSVPSLLVYLLTLRALAREDFPDMTRIVFGGEGFPKNKLKELYALFGGRARLINVYGPTECTCICSSFPVSEEEAADQSRLAPLGRMAPNFGFRIDPVADDPSFGELLVSGPNVGLGYFNDPERTSRAFVQDPGESRFRSIVYRTGDLVRLDADGLLHFRGRADNQIKHMGYRIELEEIEAAFSALGYIDEVAVIYRKSSGGSGRIIAFVGCREERPAREVLDDVRKKLPPYMIPQEVRRMPLLPKNANGKIDRVQLKAMD